MAKRKVKSWFDKKLEDPEYRRIYEEERAKLDAEYAQKDSEEVVEEITSRGPLVGVLHPGPGVPGQKKTY